MEEAEAETDLPPTPLRTTRLLTHQAEAMEDHPVIPTMIRTLTQATAMTKATVITPTLTDPDETQWIAGEVSEDNRPH